MNLKKLKMMEEVAGDGREAMSEIAVRLVWTSENLCITPSWFNDFSSPDTLKLLTQRFNAHQCHTGA